jgi:hypothetical protein
MHRAHAFIDASQQEENPSSLLAESVGGHCISRTEKTKIPASKRHGSNRILTEVVNGKILLKCSKNAKKWDDNA